MSDFEPDDVPTNKQKSDKSRKLSTSDPKTRKNSIPKGKYLQKYCYVAS